MACATLDSGGVARPWRGRSDQVLVRSFSWCGETETYTAFLVLAFAKSHGREDGGRQWLPAGAAYLAWPELHDFVSGSCPQLCCARFGVSIAPGS